MSKKVLILSGSPRKGGNSDLLCDEFAKGATEAGHNVEKIHVSEKNIHPCIACYHCSKNSGACVFKDDMAEILQKMIDADVLVLASPVYFYSIDAQLKAVIDRLAQYHSRSWYIHYGLRVLLRSSKICCRQNYRREERFQLVLEKCQLKILLRRM